MKALVKRCAAAVLAAGLLFSAGCGGTGVKTVKLDKKNPVAVTVWHYYNGAQQDAFNKLVDEFNQSEGLDQGVIVTASSMGSVNDLQTNVMDAANKKVGAADMPNIFAAYADTAYAVDQLGLAADIAPYFSQQELDAYVDGYIEEGRFSDDNSLKIFPIAKSTEVFMLNKTDWDKFSEATGADIAGCATIEGVTRLAEQYYNWTDAQTPDVPGDGKAFFGRDAMANYFLIGAKQLGVEIFAREDGKTVLNFDREVVKKLWDNYYVPFVNGWFGASGRFRSDDVKLGAVLSFVGSSSGATFFPDAVIVDDEHSYPIEMQVLPAPKFEGGENVAVQQGAGMVVTAGDEKSVYASVVFLKWFTDAARNSAFSIESGYMPVQKAANDIDFIRENTGADETEVEQIVSVAIDTVNNNQLYTTKAFANGTEARNVLEYAMFDLAKADREQILDKVAQGVSPEEAAEPYLTDGYFETWYQATRTQLEALVG